MTTRIYVVLLGINGLFAVVFGANTLLNYEGAVDGLGMAYAEDSKAMGAIVAAQFLLQGAILFMAAVWTSRNNVAGVGIGHAVGVYLVVLAAIELGWAGSTLALMFDAPRGVLLLGFGLVASRSQRRSDPMVDL